MRLWSIHPKYLDQRGLVALWRESLLAQNVLLENTKGYKNHPQLIRFKKHHEPIFAICYYLNEIFEESKHRGYNFNKSKICTKNFQNIDKIFVTKGQVEYEFEHLKNKLQIRDWNKFVEISKIKKDGIGTFDIFKIIDGGVESWEILK